MFNHILVSLDGSSYSEKALAYAQELAQVSGARVILLTVVHPLQTNLPRAERLEETSRQLAMEYLRPIQKRLQDARVKADIRVELGEPAEAIAEVAEREAVDIIAMSTHGVGGTFRDVMGSVARKVLQTAPCPVTLVRITETVRPRRIPAPPQ